MSVPEPDPISDGIQVTPALINYLPPDAYELKTLILQRHQFGIQKYGQPLMSKDGRNGIEDARQELGDLLQYLYKEFRTGKDTRTKKHTEFKLLWESAKGVIDDILYKDN